MPNVIGQAVLVIKANARGLKTGLDKAQREVSTKFGRMERRLQGFAGKIPIVGNDLKGLGGPALIASAAIGVAVTAVAGMVRKTLDLGRSLGTARETLGVSAEAIQIYRRAIEETNGSTGSFDSSVLRLTRSIGEAGTGNTAYQESFERIGLSWQDLAEMSPEDALRAVVGATNESLSASDGAAVKAELLGRGYAGMGGFASLTTAEIDDLTSSVADSAVVMGGDAVTNVDEYDAAMREMRDTIGKIAITVGTKLIPKITDTINGVQDMFNVVSPVLIPALRVLGGVIELSVIRPLTILKGTIVGVSQIIRGDFSGAWNTAKETAVNALSGIVTIYNNTIGLIPGVAQIDMEQVRDAIGVVSDKANDDLNPALEDTKEAMDNASVSTEGLTAATGELSTAEETAADRIAATRQAILDKKQAADDAEAGLSDGMLPTLDELIATMAEAETATDDTATSVRGLTTDTISFSEEGSEALTQAELSQARSYENIQAKAEETALKAEELATRQAEAAEKAADAIQAGVDRINSSWDSFITKQDATVSAMDRSGVRFGDIIERLAAKNGMTTVEMAEHYATLGVKYGDVLALIEAAGRRAIDSTIAELDRLKAAAGQGGGGGGGVDSSRFTSGGSGGGDFYSSEIGGHRIQSAASRWAQDLQASGFKGLATFDYQAFLASKDSEDRKHILAMSDYDRRRAFIRGKQSLRDVAVRGAWGMEFLADGGIIPATPGGRIVRAGEAGQREAIIPLSKLPDLMSRMMGGGNGGRPQITIMGDVYGWDDWVDKVGEANIEIEERGG